MQQIYKSIKELRACAAMAPLTASSSASVTIPDTDIEEVPPDYNHPILTTPAALQDIVPTRKTVLEIYFPKLFEFARGEGHQAKCAVLFRKYVKFLYLQPIMEPGPFIFLTVQLLDLANAAIFLTFSLCYYLALGMKKMTDINFALTHYLNRARYQICRAMQFIKRTAQELRIYKDEEHQG